MLQGSSLTPADVMALSGNDNGFGGNGSWLWFIIILVALFNGGWGNGFGGNSGAQTNYVLSSDFATLQRMIDNGFSEQRGQGIQIANGIASLGYDQLAQMNGINQNISNNGYAIQNAIQQDTIANMQNTNAITSQLASCCCENRQAIAGINYNMATQNCATNTNISNSARDIVDANNTNTQAILAKLSQMESNAKDNKIAELTALNTDLKFQASQQCQNTYLLSKLQPTPVPSYPVSGYPYGYYGTTIA